MYERKCQLFDRLNHFIWLKNVTRLVEGFPCAKTDISSHRTHREFSISQLYHQKLRGQITLTYWRILSINSTCISMPASSFTILYQPNIKSPQKPTLPTKHLFFGQIHLRCPFCFQLFLMLKALKLPSIHLFQPSTVVPRSPPPTVRCLLRPWYLQRHHLDLGKGQGSWDGQKLMENPAFLMVSYQEKWGCS